MEPDTFPIIGNPWSELRDPGLQQKPSWNVSDLGGHGQGTPEGTCMSMTVPVCKSSNPRTQIENHTFGQNTGKRGWSFQHRHCQPPFIAKASLKAFLALRHISSLNFPHETLK